MRRLAPSLLFIFLLACETKETQLQRFLLQGNQALKEQNHQGAEYYFQEALKLDPCFKDALNNLGVLHSDQKHFETAIDFFNKAIACDAAFLPSYFNRANAYYESKAYYNLLKEAAFILSIKPDTVVGVGLQGMAQAKLRQFDNAVTSFSRCIQLDPSNSEHYVNRGTVLYYQKKWDAASADFKKALQLLPTQANAMNSLGLIALEKNQLDSAKIYFDDALKIIPQQAYFLNNLGFIYLLEKNLDLAKATINQSITLDPDNAWAYRNKGIYYLHTSDFAAAERLLKQALTMDASVYDIHYYYGIALLKIGKKPEACLQFSESKKLGEGLVSDEITKGCR